MPEMTSEPIDTVAELTIQELQWLSNCRFYNSAPTAVRRLMECRATSLSDADWGSLLEAYANNRTTAEIAKATILRKLPDGLKDQWGDVYTDIWSRLLAGKRPAVFTHQYFMKRLNREIINYVRTSKADLYLEDRIEPLQDTTDPYQKAHLILHLKQFREYVFEISDGSDRRRLRKVDRLSGWITFVIRYLEALGNTETATVMNMSESELNCINTAVCRWFTAPNQQLSEDLAEEPQGKDLLREAVRRSKSLSRERRELAEFIALRSFERTTEETAAVLAESSDTTKERLSRFRTYFAIPFFRDARTSEPL